MTAAGCRASRRGAPGPQGALRPLGPQGRASLSLRDQETLPRGRLPRSLRSRRPCPANGCIRSLAHGRDHSAVSRASGSRCGLPNAPSGSPSEALRSPSRWAGKICIAAYKSSFLRFARRNDLALRTAQGKGEPLATARSRRVMGRSLRFAPITKRPRPRWAAGATRLPSDAEASLVHVPRHVVHCAVQLHAQPYRAHDATVGEADRVPRPAMRDVAQPRPVHLALAAQ